MPKQRRRAASTGRSPQQDGGVQQDPTVAAGPSGPDQVASMQSTHGNAFAQQAAQGEACGVDSYRAPTPIEPTGALDYYDRRHGDFVTRYSDCGDTFTPPDYYLGYGKKYVSRFTFETSQRLTPEGQAWMARARENLQIAIENRRSADPVDFDRMEKNNDEFRAFAFASHPDAYWEAGLGDLNLFDLTNIGATPDFADLLGWDGIVQMADITGRLAETWGTRAVDYVGGEGTADELVQAVGEGYQAVGDGIDEVFGEGTTAYLEQKAGELGVEVVELTRGAHGLAADAAGAVSSGVDSVFGEGTSAAVGNTVREGLQDGADVVEDVWNWIWD